MLRWSGGDRLSQNRPIPRSPDGDKTTNAKYAATEFNRLPKNVQMTKQKMSTTKNAT